MRLTIEWDANYNGVHIKTDTGLSLIVSGQPSMVMSWHDAVRFYKDNKAATRLEVGTGLPTSTTSSVRGMSL